MQTETTVFVVDDDPAVRQGLSILLRSVHRNAEFYPSTQAFLDAYHPAQPGCLVLDVRMPGGGGLELQEYLYTRGLDIPIIFITGHGDVPAAVRAMQAGAVDFIEKPFNDQVLLDRIDRAIRQDAQNRARGVTDTLRKEHLALLTRREREVMDRLVEGRSCKQIAAEFGVSFQAVATHRGRIIQKMEVENVVDLVRTVL